jgi:hypothetical protein
VTKAGGFFIQCSSKIPSSRKDLLHGKHALDEGGSEVNGEEMNDDGPCQTNSRILAKTKKAWTIPEDLLKEMVDLETVVVLNSGARRKI